MFYYLHGTDGREGSQGICGQDLVASGGELHVSYSCFNSPGLGVAHNPFVDMVRCWSPGRLLFGCISKESFVRHCNITQARNVTDVL